MDCVRKRRPHTNHPRFALALEGVHDLDLVKLGDALSDGDNETNLSLDGLEDSVGSEGRRNIDDSRIGRGLLDGLDDEGRVARR